METGHLSLVGLSKEGGMETLWRKSSQRPKEGELILKHAGGESPFGHFFSEDAIWLNIPLPKWQKQKTIILLYVTACSFICVKHVGSKHRARFNSSHPQLILLLRK